MTNTHTCGLQGMYAVMQAPFHDILCGWFDNTVTMHACMHACMGLAAAGKVRDESVPEMMTVSSMLKVVTVVLSDAAYCKAGQGEPACVAGLRLSRLRPCLHGSLRSQTHPRSTMTLMVRSSLSQGVIACLWGSSDGHPIMTTIAVSLSGGAIYIAPLDMPYNHRALASPSQ